MKIPREYVCWKFTDNNILLVYTERIFTMKNKIIKTKKNNDVMILPTKLSLVNCEYYSSC
jgi:hypothetical protein